MARSPTLEDLIKVQAKIEAGKEKIEKFYPGIDKYSPGALEDLVDCSGYRN